MTVAVINLEALTQALVEVEESKVDTYCLTDTCEHFAALEECPDFGLGCGDAEAIARAYEAIMEER